MNLRHQILKYEIFISPHEAVSFNRLHIGRDELFN